MKRLFLIFLSLINLSAFADVSATYNTEEAEHFAEFTLDNTPFKADYNTLIENLRKLNPGIVQEIESSSDTEDVKLSRIRSYLAQEVFDFYKNKFFSDLKQRSKDTGREIKQQGDRYWLDRGELDKKECQTKEERIICFYPDNFEEYLINLNTNSSGQVDLIFLDKDVPLKDYHLSCIVNINQDADSGSSSGEAYSYQNIFLNVDCITEKFSEHHEWRNLEVEDTKAGRFNTLTRREKRKQELLKRRGEVYDYGTPDSSKLPDSVVNSVDI